ncbi:hypothetical protein B0H10DRAFT_2044492 [Mycena sp. CBHHK59/15]|nr:hypothetical protein B0H10DRAFT_2044492 [Mycena sp. CBHHK59/15]
MTPEYTPPTPQTFPSSAHLYSRACLLPAPQATSAGTRADQGVHRRTSGASIARIQLLHLCLCFGYGLRDHPTTRPHAKRGATALIYSPNSLAWPVALHGSVAAGLRVTFANSAYTSRGLAHQYLDSDAKLLFSAEEGIRTVRAMFAELGIRRTRGTSRRRFGARSSMSRGPDVGRSPDAGRGS